MKKWIALLLGLCMLMSLASCQKTADPVSAVPTVTVVPADETATTTEETPADETAATADAMDASLVLATVYGEEITWGDIASFYEELVLYYGPYYDMSDPANEDLFRAVALDTYITDKVLERKGVELNLTLTEEEKTEAEANAQTDWDAAIQNFVATSEGATEESAVAYFNEMGYTPEQLKEDYVNYATEDKIYQYIVKDIVVTDEDVEAYYQELVATDKELYGSDVSAYESYNSYVYQMDMYAMYYGSENNLDRAWYRPAGFRQVKHILLPVDETLMSNYQGLQAQFEEQFAAEEAEPVEGAEAPETSEPVTQAQVDEAKAAILDSVADTVAEINDKLNGGATFDELMAEYSMDYQEGGSNIYEVSVASTMTYVPEFVEAAFSVDNIGDVSAPFISAYGVHIVLYVDDVPEGPIEMTPEQREAKRTQLLTEKQDALYTTTVEGWIAEADIVYTGVIPNLEELMAQQAVEEEVPAEEVPAVESTEETPAEETSAEETTEEVPAVETTEEAPVEEVPAEEVPAE